jgi:hypothetical protein
MIKAAFVTRIFQVGITLVIAIAFPDLGNFVSLVGCVGLGLAI